jgi:hypothetical protein
MAIRNTLQQMITSIEQAINDLLNGNLTDAINRAKKITLQSILDEAIWQGYTFNEGLMMACYLKQQISFQEYCDNMNNTR